MKNNLQESREYALKRLDRELNKARFETVIGILESENIKVPEYVKNERSLKSYLKSNLQEQDRNIIDNIFKESSELLEKTINELKKGSTTAFKDFLNKLDTIVKPFSKALANSLALRTLIALSPGLPEKVLVSSLLLLRTGYNLNKGVKYRNIANKNYELNKMITELEVSYDEHKRKDTRFDDQIINTIKDFFKRNNIKYNDIGYLELRETLYKLDLDKKKAIVNIINNLEGNKINIEERLSKYNDNLLTKAKKRIVKPIVVGGTVGITAATTINAIEPALTAGLYNGTIVGKIVSNITTDKLAGFISGSATYASSFFLKYIPIIGEFFENIMAYENVIVSAILGGALGLTIDVGKNIGLGAKNIYQKIASSKEQLDFIKLDSKLHYEDNLKELEAKSKYYEEKDVTNEEKAIILLVKRFMLENKIEVDENINTLIGLKNYISTLKIRDKNKIYSFLDKLEDLRKHNNSYFRIFISIVGKSLYLASVLSLAGLSIADLILNGKLFNEMSAILYDNPTVIDKSEIPVIKKEVEIVTYDTPKGENIAPIIKPEVTPNPYATPKPIEPGPLLPPSPTPTPTPTPVPTVEPMTSVPIPEPLPSIPEIAPMPSIIDTGYIDLIYKMDNGGMEFFREMNTYNSSQIYKELELLAKFNNSTKLATYVNNIEFKTITNLFKYIKENISTINKEYGETIMPFIEDRVNQINEMILRSQRIDRALAESVSAVNLISEVKKRK